VLVTNGGMGGTQQAIAAGVPVIVAGVTEDKPAVAARAAYHGLGIDLKTATPAPEAVAAAVESVIKDFQWLPKRPPSCVRLSGRGRSRQAGDDVGDGLRLRQERVVARVHFDDLVRAA
jgi:Erythromycin biosynthesis protein CIII-like, C-terminal domain